MTIVFKIYYTFAIFCNKSYKTLDGVVWHANMMAMLVINIHKHDEMIDGKNS